MKSIVIRSSNGFTVDFRSDSWDEAVGWAKGRCSSSGSPYMAIEVSEANKYGRFVIFYRDAALNVLEWKFWEKG